MPFPRLTDNRIALTIQTVNPAMVTGTSMTATLTNTLLRSLIVVYVGTSGRTDTITTPTDDAGNTYVVGYSSNAGTGGTTAMYYARNAQPATVVTVGFSGSTDTKSVFVQEFSGLAQSDSILSAPAVAHQGTASGTNTVSATWTGNASAAGIAVCSATLVVASPSLTAGSFYGGFFQQTNVSPAFAHAVELGASVANGAGAGLMTASSGAFNCGVAPFMARPSGGVFQYSYTRPHPFQPGQTR